MCLLLDTIYMLLQGIHLAIAISLALKDHIVFCYLIGDHYRTSVVYCLNFDIVIQYL